MLFAKVAIERHRNITNENAPYWRDANFPWSEINKALLAQSLELERFLFEVLAKAD